MSKELHDMAEQELVQRELSRNSLIAFAERFVPGYSAGWFHRLLAAKLEKFYEDVKNKKSPRLIIAVPPRGGKSKLASQLFPAWTFGKDPAFEFIVASYATSLPMDFSRFIRETLKSPEYKVLFPETELDPNSQALDGWYTKQNGAFFPSGVGSGITGRGCHALIIDDPFKDDADASSETMQAKTWEWYTSTALTRVAPGGGVLVIATRWNMRDLTGQLLTQQEDKIKQLTEELTAATNEEYRAFLQNELDTLERWDTVFFPAIAETDEYITPDLHLTHDPKPGYIRVRKKGDALHPERFDEGALKRIKDALPSRQWNALYQQNPIPEEGSFFKKSELHYTPIIRYPEFPILQAWDFAIGTKQQNDWTVGITGFMDFTGVLHIIDMVRIKGGTFEIVSAMCDQAQKHNPSLIGMERGHISMAIMPVLEEELKARRLHPPIDADIVPVNDKLTRARPLQGMMQRGMVSIDPKSPWYNDLIREILQFPYGMHDDIVDTLAHLAKMSMDVPLPQPPKKNKRKSWRDTLKRHVTLTGNNHLQA